MIQLGGMFQLNLGSVFVYADENASAEATPDALAKAKWQHSPRV